MATASARRNTTVAGGRRDTPVAGARTGYHAGHYGRRESCALCLLLCFQLDTSQIVDLSLFDADLDLRFLRIAVAIVELVFPFVDHLHQVEVLLEEREDIVPLGDAIG